MKDCHVCSGFRKLGASYCVSLKEHLNKTLYLPGQVRGSRLSLRRTALHICVSVYMYWMCAAAGAEGSPVPVQLHKVLGDSQSWVELSGKERGPRARTVFSAGPLGRSGGFGLSGSLLVISRATLVWQGSGDTHTSPPAVEAAG